MGQTLRYDPATRKVVAIDNGNSGGSSSQAGTSWYGIKGEVKATLLAFAKEDNLDFSTPALEGRACNAYVDAAVKEFIAARKALAAKPKPVIPTGTVAIEPKPKPEVAKAPQPVASQR